MTLRQDMLNGHRTAHGGMIFSLADTAFAYVCNGGNERTVAAQANIVFLDAAKEGETLIAEGEELSRVVRQRRRREDDPRPAHSREVLRRLVEESCDELSVSASVIERKP